MVTIFPFELFQKDNSQEILYTLLEKSHLLSHPSHFVPRSGISLIEDWISILSIKKNKTDKTPKNDVERSSETTREDVTKNE